MSTENTKQHLYPIFAKNFNEMIGYVGEKPDRKARAAAKRLGVDYEKVRTWSEGLYLPKGEALLNISEKYPDINIDWLLTGRGNKDTSSSVPPDEDVPMVLMPSELRAVYPDLEYIFSSKNPGVKQALSANIREFKESVIKDEKAAERDAKIDKLEEDVRELKNRERQDCSGTKEKKRESSIKKKKAM